MNTANYYRLSYPQPSTSQNVSPPQKYNTISYSPYQETQSSIVTPSSTTKYPLPQIHENISSSMYKGQHQINSNEKKVQVISLKELSKRQQDNSHKVYNHILNPQIQATYSHGTQQIDSKNSPCMKQNYISQAKPSYSTNFTNYPSNINATKVKQEIKYDVKNSQPSFQNHPYINYQKYQILERQNKRLHQQILNANLQLQVAERTIAALQNEKNNLELKINQSQSTKTSAMKSVSKVNKKIEGSLKAYLQGFQQQNLQLISKYNELQLNRDKIATQLQSALLLQTSLELREKSQQRTIRRLHQQLSSIANSLNFKNKNTYQIIMKAQISQISQLNSNYETILQQNNLLKQKIKALQREIENAHNQISVTQLKGRTQKNKIVTELGIQLNDKSNQIQALNRKISTMEQKYKSAASDIKAKDQFFRNHLAGRSQSAQEKSYVIETMKKYENKFSLDAHNHDECQRIIEDLQQKLKNYEEVY